MRGKGAIYKDGMTPQAEKIGGMWQQKEREQNKMWMGIGGQTAVIGDLMVEERMGVKAEVLQGNQILEGRETGMIGKSGLNPVADKHRVIIVVSGNNVWESEVRGENVAPVKVVEETAYCRERDLADVLQNDYEAGAEMREVDPLNEIEVGLNLTDLEINRRMWGGSDRNEMNEMNG